MFKIHKNVLVITIAAALLFIAGAGLLIRKQTPGEEQNKNQEQAQVNNESANLNNEEAVAENPDDKYKGVITKEEGGWKKYRNEYWGIEFEFEDSEDVMEFQEGSSGLSIRGPVPEESKQHYPEDDKNPYIYINFHDYSNKNYNSLKNYLETVGWNNYQNPAELISIKEFNNKNDIRFYEVLASVKSCNMVPDESGNRSCKTFDSKQYYTEYNKLDNKDYLVINYMEEELCREVLDLFQFIQ
ncbi:hypothetical protein A2303_06820 [Candidatus Falkowbacteria bacterium RIFOXYB2_FULL_47_14]|uniref:Uncharacterized protein n=1 Tax=Candidatus Falkowbacteria bacterium RIFOXYA2_FULL_47_19 TaxID=1797994 RepID=A0A1F5SG67_9BACT|nr:MAG: hypothetical protein A2227_00565 [Candidatus Falkowbacteria bacterium RIFOXYA2_FULL_47_19]OGF35508.1 MAG: hypothetical protein A2468_05705 [Candidatus Falkowbacteria bacterium RIFOXYC2_FULL_46_15]OGF43582.1 MAG: hypothetical protein A2303_06820 [Candidatus Falkowbacteria bacterium RIFOXYB2_FULL_47_14]